GESLAGRGAATDGDADGAHARPAAYANGAAQHRAPDADAAGTDVAAETGARDDARTAHAAGHSAGNDVRATVGSEVGSEVASEAGLAASAESGSERGVAHGAERAREPAADAGAAIDVEPGASAESATAAVAPARHAESAATSPRAGNAPAGTPFAAAPPSHAAPAEPPHRAFSAQRALSYMWREMLELRRDPVRATLALIGSLVLMCVIGIGISLDVEDLTYAVLDRDQTELSHDYALNLSGSRYFVERPPIADYAALDRRMRDGELSLAIEIPPNFARDVERGAPAQIGMWIDGAMPQRAETIRGYAIGMHTMWLADKARHRLGVTLAPRAEVVTRYRYNPDVKSLPAMIPAVMPLLLLMLPAMLTALAVVRERELGSILNLYVTPVTRTEFLIGKQVPYVVLAMLNFLLMTMLARIAFDVPVKGSFMTLLLAVLIFNVVATGIGLLASTFTRSQVAAIVMTIIGTMIPTVQFAGLLTPLSSLEGTGRLIGLVYPATYMLSISRGVFNKALSLHDLYSQFWPLAASVPVILGATILLLKKQER
ncbi:ABC transporter permease, partial [Burkholderia pseudomallei]|nr:ABC transporter permease [Burkholderia pseudomallei]